MRTDDTYPEAGFEGSVALAVTEIPVVAVGVPVPSTPLGDDGVAVVVCAATLVRLLVAA